MPKSPMLTGEDRIEFSPLLGRTIRSGALAHFKVADQDKLAEWIRARRTEDAVALLEVMKLLYVDMNRILLEWSLSWGQRIREDLGIAEETKITTHVHSIWSEIVRVEKESPEHIEAGKTVISVLSPEIRRSRADCQTLSEQLNAVPLAAWHEVVQITKEKKAEEALAKFAVFIRKSRAVHDYLCQYLWVYPTETEKSYGQAFSERMMIESFQSCTMYEGFIKLIAKLSPEGVVALMAEHLRGHYSGPDRRGKVEIVDNPDNYTIVFDGCGSGGAMRRKNAGKNTRGLENYSKASPSTWNMKGVSSFCAHCAQNEIFMVRRFGFPVWVVNYDPDPMKPCSWTIFKDYTNVPDKFYERIGFKKDPDKMAKLSTD